jgi:MFS transporter, ACS family, tartrate transporter
MSPLHWKIARRLVPFLILLYLVAFLDRVNVSFAALTMNRDLNIGEALFGLAAGMFFLGYFLFEVPSNLVLLRVGARRWITAIMIAWGCLSVATAFVHGPASYILLRFLLGLAESGFYPGVILYLTFWLPPSVRSSIMAMFVTAIPLSNLIGAPISAQILSFDHVAGLRGWQWLFLLEGSPAILLGAIVFFVLPDRPEHVNWLTPEELRTLRAQLQPVASRSSATHSLLESFTAHPSVYSWSFAYFTLMIGLYALGFWIPKVLVSHGVSLANTGWAAALPYLAGIAGMLFWSHRSDYYQERRFHLTASYLAAAAGFILTGFAPSAPWAVAGFALCATGILSAMPVFWSGATIRLAGPMVAAHIAVINSIGNLGGFVSPIAIGWFKQRTHNFAAGLYFVAISLACGAVAVAMLCRPFSRSKRFPPAVTTSASDGA